MFSSAHVHGPTSMDVHSYNSEPYPFSESCTRPSPFSAHGTTTTSPPVSSISSSRPSPHPTSTLRPKTKFVPYQPAESSKVLSTSHVPINATPSDDIVDQLLLSPDQAHNVFKMEPAVLIKLLKLHHIAIPPKLTIRGARHAMLSHLIAGTCAGSIEHTASTTHKCKCALTRGIFDSQQSMSFSVISTLLSSSLERLPDTHVALVAEALGLTEFTRSHLNQHLHSRRNSLVSQHAVTYPARLVFSDLDSLPKGTLIAVALAHGLTVSEDDSREAMRTRIATHIAMGSCTQREAATPSLACSSIRPNLIRNLTRVQRKTPPPVCKHTLCAR